MHSHCKKMNPTLLLFFDRLKYYYFVCVLLLVARVTEIPNRVGVCSLCFVYYSIDIFLVPLPNQILHKLSV